MKTQLLCIGAVLFALVAGTAQAQIGSNWMINRYPELLDPEINNSHLFTRPVPRHYVSPQQYCSYTNANDIEEFHLQNSLANRIEVRVQNDYFAPAGGRQFEGDVMLLPPTGNECVMQIFGNNVHATLFMLRGDAGNGGSLRHYARELLATNVYNTWVHVNVIHMPGKFEQVYINGVFKGQWTDNSGDHPHYYKYGCYGTLDTPSAGVKWKNVKFFTGGNPPGFPAAKMED